MNRQPKVFYYMTFDSYVFTEKIIISILVIDTLILCISVDILDFIVYQYKKNIKAGTTLIMYNGRSCY